MLMMHAIQASYDDSLNHLNRLEDMLEENFENNPDVLMNAINEYKKELRSFITANFPTVTSHSLVRNVTTEDEVSEVTIWTLYYNPERKEVIGLRREVSRYKDKAWDLIGIRESYVIDDKEFDNLYNALRYDLEHLIVSTDVNNKNNMSFDKLKEYTSVAY